MPGCLSGAIVDRTRVLCVVGNPVAIECILYHLIRRNCSWSLPELPFPHSTTLPWLETMGEWRKDKHTGKLGCSGTQLPQTKSTCHLWQPGTSFLMCSTREESAHRSCLSLSNSGCKYPGRSWSCYFLYRLVTHSDFRGKLCHFPWATSQ